MAYSPDYRAAPRFGAGTAQAAVLDQGLRAYMLRVYNWMSSGLPTPESSRSCGEPIAPAARITSTLARAS